MAGCGNFALFIEIFQHLETPSGIMGNALGVFVVHGFPVGPSLRPVGAQRHESAFRNGSVSFFPTPDIFDRDGVIRIFRCFLMHINHNQRQDHFPDIDLVHCAQPFNEVSGRIDMGSPLSDMRERLRIKTASQTSRTRFIGIERLPHFIGEPFPAGNPRSKSMGEIHKLFCPDHLPGIPQRQSICSQAIKP
ncbi:MAG: hypothetical protein BWX99_02701 [Deltaproteobacteria bacterium ADurb.Bin151]|nr:MAG: hypothetical protein BWX99_02701 [Deltaproteobacteria bacterium ADurb.Bin151]